ncbi:acyltransferase family protein [Algoriphagus chordae]|uniref:Peptidoglycan/LPS O-acetylase OafA/YrhL n=1 Tax=Algoriphagus chordae TaxID=237019 RepID=A0A2W7SKZ5_9BACT|nr:acyltransferase [Algoriphagus chordae]PZX51342.1 peptidoglycan/LPS O-acetylase OafA/YrhL [Algoriphagus chordae]
MKYIKQFDSVRGISVIFIVLYHWLSVWDLAKNYIDKIPTGFTLVDVFFVLSGFLITRILLINRGINEEKNIDKPLIYKNFVIRRALRIFPAYYLVLILLFAFDSSLDKSKLVYFATYTSNFYFYHVQEWDPYFSHLWTLSVEEQFYLFWPILVLYVKRKHLPHLFLIYICIGVISEYFLFDNEFGQCLTFTCFDSFGLGALVAWMNLYKMEWMAPAKKFFGWLTIAHLFLFTYEYLNNSWTFIPVTSLLSVFTAWFLLYIIILTQAPTYKPSIIWDNPVLIYIGKISYGIYLYHFMLPNYSGYIFYPLNEYLPEALTEYYFLILLVENFILLLIISWLSRILVEKPFMNLKRYFTLGKPEGKTPSYSVNQVNKT